MSESNPNQTNLRMKAFRNKQPHYEEFHYLTIQEIYEHLNIGARRGADVADDSKNLMFDLYKMGYKVVRIAGERELEETGYGYHGSVYGNENPVRHGDHYICRYLFFAEPYKSLLEYALNSCITIEDAYKELESIGERVFLKYLVTRDDIKQSNSFVCHRDEYGITVCPEED